MPSKPYIYNGNTPAEVPPPYSSREVPPSAAVPTCSSTTYIHGDMGPPPPYPDVSSIYPSSGLIQQTTSPSVGPNGPCQTKQPSGHPILQSEPRSQEANLVAQPGQPQSDRRQRAASRDLETDGCGDCCFMICCVSLFNCNGDDNRCDCDKCDCNGCDCNGCDCDGCDCDGCFE